MSYSIRPFNGKKEKEKSNDTAFAPKLDLICIILNEQKYYENLISECNLQKF